IVFLEDMLALTRDILIAQTTSSSDHISFVFTPEEKLRFEALTHSVTSSKLLKYASVIEDIYYKTGKYSENIKLTFEITLIELCKISTDPSYDDLCERVAVLETLLSQPRVAEKAVSSVSVIAPSDKALPARDTHDDITEYPSPANSTDNSKDGHYTHAAALIGSVKSSRSVWAVLKGCTFTQNDDVLNIHCDSFAKDILSQHSATELIESSASTLSGHPIRIKFIPKGAPEKESHDLIDEIIPPEDK
ncbi:MAG TPA: hypothetical protein PLT66_07375, partial [Bacillota bacterium]|nr:hypothetical protein [Bacillota bacterium]